MLCALVALGCVESNPQPSPGTGPSRWDRGAPEIVDKSPRVDASALPDILDWPHEEIAGARDFEPAGGADTQENGDGSAAVDDGYLDNGPPCVSHADCPGGRCVPGYGGWTCSPKCEEDLDCQAGWACGAVAKSQGKPEQYCAPLFATLCAPCTTNQDCTGLGDPDKADVPDPSNYAVPQIKFLEHHCTSTGPEDPVLFCTVHVTGIHYCPAGFHMQQDWRDEIGQFDVCVPDGPGTCPSCPWAAIERAALGAGCPHGVKGNLCPGVHTCGPEGLSACVAPVLTPEVRDDVDNDCNGVVDDVCPTLPDPAIDGCFCGDTAPCWEECVLGACGDLGGCDCGECPADFACINGSCAQGFVCEENGKGPGCECGAGEKSCAPELCVHAKTGGVCTAYCGATCTTPPLWWLPMLPCVKGCPPGLGCRPWDLEEIGLVADICLPPLYCEKDPQCAGILHPLTECEEVRCVDNVCSRVDAGCEACAPKCFGKCTGEDCPKECDEVCPVPCVGGVCLAACGDDGCGGKCGECAAGQMCLEGLCVACPEGCEVIECGSSCGTDCGECEPGFVCDTAGLCECDCKPACDGKECGPDGCGGECAECPAGSVCTVEGVCCKPECEGKECGPDGCGAICGVCPAGEECSGGACIQCTPKCEGKECGPDGCGGACGGCSEGLRCASAGSCEPCWPCCQGKECGDDGCGGTCGTCLPNETCVDGTCQSDCYASQYCTDQFCGPTSDYCHDCGLCPKSWKCSPVLDVTTWQAIQQCIPDPTGPCRRAEDCYKYVAKDLWPEGFKPICAPGTCSCAVTN